MIDLLISVDLKLVKMKTIYLEGEMQCNWSFFWMLLSKLALSYGVGAVVIFLYIYFSRKFALHCGSLDWAVVILCALFSAAVYFFSSETSILNTIIGIAIIGLGVAIYYYLFMLIFIIMIGL